MFFFNFIMNALEKTNKNRYNKFYINKFGNKKNKIKINVLFTKFNGTTRYMKK